MTDVHRDGSRPRVLAIIQARMSSTRLPGKVMRLILGRPMVAHQMARLQRCRLIDQLVLATSVEASDDPLATLCDQEGWACHRGALHDVLDRYEGAARAFGPADHVVRLTADCPLIDPAIVDATIELHLAEMADYTTNALEGARTFPNGLDTEVMTRDVLARTARDAVEQSHREHVTMFIYRNRDQFRLSSLKQGRALGALRWTVDTPQDFAFATAVFTHLQSEKPNFDQDDVLGLLARHPELALINAA